MRTWSRISTALSVSAAESACACWRSTSSICRPTLRIGLSAARGFWKIIDISRPRRSRIWSSSAARTSTPENITEPSAMRPARSRMRITANEVTDLPEPDSPTIATVSPLATAMLMCCTALTMPRRVENSTVRSLDVEQRHGRRRVAAQRFAQVHGPHVRRCGSTMSRSPSPSRLKQNTAIISASPGKNAIHHSPDTMKAAPSATMMPHSASAAARRGR